MTALVEFIDDRFSGIDIDSLLNGERKPLSYERKKALYEAPEFLQRLSGEETVMEGQSLCIECKIRGFPVPSVRWFKDDEEILGHHRIQIQCNGIGGYFLVIDNVTREDEAAYRCRAENVEGACSSFFFLSVKGKPKNPKSRDPSGVPGWRTVSYPPMFSTIVERVEEEEIEGRELEQLPSSPLTEFYYALTLKSRCVWPTFLGDWAFANGHPQTDEKNSDDDDDEDEGYNEVDDDEEEDDGIYNKLFIPNGYICDKLKPQISNKAHLAAKQSLRRSQSAAKAKSKKLDQKVVSKTDKMEDKNKLEKDSEIIFKSDYEANDNANGNMNERKERHEHVSLDKTKLEDKFQRNGREKEGTETREEDGLTNAKKIVAMKSMDADRLANDNQDGEEKWQVTEEGKEEQKKSQVYIWTAVERANQVQENKRRLKEERMKREEEMRNEENERKKQEEMRNEENERKKQEEMRNEENERKKQEEMRTEEKERKKQEEMRNEEKERKKQEEMRNEEKERKKQEEMRNEENERKKQEKIQRSLNEEHKHRKLLIESKNDVKKSGTTEDGRYEKQEQKDVNRKVNQTRNIVEVDENKQEVNKCIDDKHTSSESKISPKETSKTLDKPLFWKNGKNILETLDKFLDSMRESRQVSAPLPGALRIFKFRPSENIPLKQQHNLKHAELPRDKSPNALNKQNLESTNQQERSGIRHVKSDNEIYSWQQANDTTTRYSYMNIQKSTAETEQRSSLARPRMIKDNRALKNSNSQDRLEELRQQESKRMEELKQEEMKRMEELKQEDKTTAVGLHRRGLFNRGDVLAREKKQIEELRRKEQLLRDELRQKEQKQLEELRLKEGKDIDGLRKDQIVSGTLTEQEQRNESFNKQREQLRLKELFQKEELRLKEIQHMVELHFKELLHKEKLKEHEQKQIEELKGKERRQLQEVRKIQQKVYGDIENDAEEELRKKKNREELLIQYKKEQLRKAQLRRQFEEETEKREKKEEEAKKWREQEPDLKKEKDLKSQANHLLNNQHQSSESGKVYNVKPAEESIFSDHSLSKNDFSVNNSRITTSSVASSNRERGSRFSSGINNSEDKDYLRSQPPQEPVNTWRASFTNSLDRPRKGASDSLKLPKEEEFLKRSTSFKDNYQSIIESVHTNQESQRFSEVKETEITTRAHKANSSLASCETGSNCQTSAPIQSPTSWSFASLFGMDDSKNSKTSLRTHDELCKLARSIAEKREQFREYLSNTSLAEPVPLATDTAYKTPSYLLGREASDNNGIPVNKRAIDSSENCRDNYNLEELKTVRIQPVADYVRDNMCTLPLMRNRSRETAAFDSSSMSGRSFLRNSARTMDRRFYHTE